LFKEPFMLRAPRTFALTPDLRDLLRKNAQGHKYAHGHALVLSGGRGRSGAARLAARGALRVGAGLVTVAAPPDAVPEVACQLTAIMLREIDTGAALTELLADQRINALCLGPGWGLADLQGALLLAALAAKRATVLDADALTLLARDKAARAALHPACVLTPHEGEFARVFPDLTPDLTNGLPARAQAARQAALRAGCTVLLKGPETLVASPDGLVWLHPAQPDGAQAWLATAGSGDVLAGFICGLMARGIAPALAANIGVWLHRQAAERFGPGLIAEDLPEILPAVLRQIGV
jgi:hydroxyethylthiazole kinase-like uncharacterized protein yjeF